MALVAIGIPWKAERIKTPHLVKNDPKYQFEDFFG